MSDQNKPAVAKEENKTDTKAAEVAKKPVMEMPEIPSKTATTKPKQGDIASVIKESTVKRGPSTISPAQITGGRLRDYAEKMSGKILLTKELRMRAQLELNAIFTSIGRYNAGLFNEVMDEVVKIVREYRDTTFSEHSAMRELSSMEKSGKMSKATRKSMESVIMILMTAADCKNRREVSQRIDITSMTSSVHPAALGSMLASYFKK